MTVNRLPSIIRRAARLATAVILLLPALILSAAQPLRVGITPSTPPTIFKQGKDIVGLEADFARVLGEKLNRPIEFVEVDWKDQVPELVAGKTDIIMSSMSITRGRMTQIDFTVPYLRVGQMALVRRADQGKYLLGFPPILPEPIGVISGTTGDFLVQQEWAKTKRKTYKTGDEATEALLKNRIGLFIADATLVWWLAGKYETKGVTTLPMMLSDEQLAWGIRKGQPELLAQLNGFVEELRESGQLQTLIARWLPQAK